MTEPFEVGKTYKIDHSRKGKFSLTVTSVSETWMTGIIVEGTANAMMDYNTKEAGEEITVRRTHVTIIPDKIKKKIKPKRGSINGAVRAKSQEVLGYEMTLSELRLIPYIGYLMMNEQRLDIRKVNDAEWKIIDKWKDKGFMTVNNIQEVTITKQFWDAISEIQWLCYVDIDRS